MQCLQALFLENILSSVTAREASRLHWLDTVVTPVTVKHLPNRKAISATKPILTQVSPQQYVC